MTKKKYLAMMEEYQRHIEAKSFNPGFYDNKRLDELKVILSEVLFSYKRKVEVILLDTYGGRSIDARLRLRHIEDICLLLIDAIKREQSIKEFDYKKCHVESRIGFLTLNQFFILMIICILIFVCRRILFILM